jgi:hypothetical protein
LAAAAAAVLVVAGVVAVVAATGSDDETDTATPEPGTASPAEPSDAGTGDVEPGAAESADELRAALTRSAEATTEARTANVTFRAVADAELSVGPVRLEMAGSGQVELPGRSILNTRTTLSAADAEVLLPPEEASVVEDGDRTFVRCGGEPDYTEQSTEAADCATLDLGPELFGPDATIDMLAEAESLDIVEVGEDTLDGDHITGYQVVQPVALDGASVPLVMQIWIDDDALMRRIVGAAEYSAAEDPTLRSLVITYELSDFGVPVDIPELD